MTDLAIRIVDLHKSYRRGWLRRRSVHAVSGLDLEIRRGEAWALAGPNGAGKTTTLHCLLGLLHADAGSIEVLGEDPRQASSRRALGFQSEIFHSYSYRTANDVLRFYGRLSGLEGTDLRHRVDRVLQSLGLTSARDQRLGTFSKGMMQRLGLAQSLLHDAEVIIWDEPSTGLDPEGRRLVADLVMGLRDSGRTVLLSTHILADIERTCDHIAIMKAGRVLESTDMQGLLAANAGKTLEDVFLETVRAHGDPP
jgi:ABC-2 type transport system ATP-binding protein